MKAEEAQIGPRSMNVSRKRRESVESSISILRYPFSDFPDICAENKEGEIDKEGSSPHCGRPSTALHQDDLHFFLSPSLSYFQQQQDLREEHFMQTMVFPECSSPSLGPDYELYLESHSGEDRPG
jgi:hypothetical protein